MPSDLALTSQLFPLRPSSVTTLVLLDPWLASPRPRSFALRSFFDEPTLNKELVSFILPSFTHLVDTHHGPHRSAKGECDRAGCGGMLTRQVTQALGLVSSISKPIPVVGGIGSGLLDTVGGLTNSTIGSGSGALNGLLGGGTGILAAGVGDNATTSAYEESSSGVDGSTQSFGNTTTYEATDGSDAAAPSPNSTASAAGDDSCAFEPYNPGSIPIEPFAPYNASQALVYRYRQQQSVNLGSWFVQEQWMNPTLFKCASGNKQAEYDVANGWGGVDGARQVLERHWDEWITEKDFAYLASIGINTVRLPIGYWSLGPYYCQGTVFENVSAAYVNSWSRVVRAINWAEKYGLGILVDLHGAPGSQNGQGHSGTSDGAQNLFNNPTNIQLTINALTYLTQQLVKVNNVVGIQLLNEPSNVDSLPSFYSNTLSVLRQVSPEAAAFPFYIHDGFDLSRFADYISTRQDFVVLDHHSYFVFGDADSQKTPANQLTSSLSPGQGSVSQQIISAAAEERRNIVIDEFSCALSGDALSGSSDPTGDRRKFCTGQMESYTNATAGWSFWSYKTEGCPSDTNWCFTSAVGNSLPSTFFSYPKATVASLAAQALPSSSPSESAVGGPSGSSFLSFGTSMPDESAYSPPTTDDWLAAVGKDSTTYNYVTEALATTEYDQPEMDIAQGDARPVDKIAMTQSAQDTASSEVASASGGEMPSIRLAQSPFMAADTATIPSSRIPRRNLLGSLPQRAFLFASDINRHRFVARHHRRSASRQQHRRLSANARRDDSTLSTSADMQATQPAQSYTPEQAAISKGYADGWRAAKTFASFGQSRLGFTGQFMTDALNAMGSQIVRGDEGHYKTWFMKGLADGELQVIKMMALEGQGPQ